MGEKISWPLCFCFSLVAAQAAACDWRISSDKVDPMTDQRVCIIRSEAAGIAVSVHGKEVRFLTASAYTRDGLALRIDDNAPITLHDARATTAYGSQARDALAQIRTGTRLRTSYRDYPASREGDAPICTLPSLIDSCAGPAQ